MAEITRWQIMTHPVDITKFNFASVEVDPGFIWTRKDKDGRTEWDKLQQLSTEGWELVSVTPIVTASNLSHTSKLLYTFKRPMP